MAIDFRSMLNILPAITDARYPVLIRGRHGIGKSTIVYQYGG
jgi:MoxR-like ATPase